MRSEVEAFGTKLKENCCIANHGTEDSQKPSRGMEQAPASALLLELSEF